MLKFKLISIGKSSPKWIEHGINEYITRLKPYSNITCIWTKKNNNFIEIVEKEDQNSIICLDATVENNSKILKNFHLGYLENLIEIIQIILNLLK